MTDSLKQLILNALAILGTVLGLLGLAKFAGIVDYILQNFDGIWAAIGTVIAFVVGILAHFKSEKLAIKRGLSK